jgi:hypothetical protein
VEVFGFAVCGRISASVSHFVAAIRHSTTTKIVFCGRRYPLKGTQLTYRMEPSFSALPPGVFRNSATLSSAISFGVEPAEGQGTVYAISNLDQYVAPKR